MAFTIILDYLALSFNLITETNNKVVFYFETLTDESKNPSS
jgi:hypothetical protein